MNTPRIFGQMFQFVPLSAETCKVMPLTESSHVWVVLVDLSIEVC